MGDIFIVDSRATSLCPGETGGSWLETQWGGGVGGGQGVRLFSGYS